MTQVEPAELDLRGKTITTYVVYEAATRLETMAAGEVLELLTDDYEPFRHDVPAWCEAAGHKLLSTQSTPRELRFQIEKGPPNASRGRLAVVLSSDGLEELLSPLGFALAAALERVDVHIYVQGPAVRVLARGFRPKLHGWTRPFSRIAANGLSKAGHLPAQDKLRQLRNLGARIYLCGPSMQHFKVEAEDLLFDDLPVVEYFTFVAVMREASIHIYA
jgi:TusA-related sulfurtransferase/predicted peroxiredoxin